MRKERASQANSECNNNNSQILFRSKLFCFVCFFIYFKIVNFHDQQHIDDHRPDKNLHT